MKAGILYSSSKAYPGLVPDFTQAIKTVLQNNKEVTLVMESVGNGGLEKEVFEKAEKLLLIESVDVLVAYIDLKVLPIIKPLVYSTNKLLIVVNAGANYPDNWVAQSNIVYLTLQHSFECWLTGLLAKEKQAALATGFFDAGFLHISALTKNFFAHNGQLLHNYVNRDTNKDFTIEPFTNYLRSNPGLSSIIAVFDLSVGELFYQKLTEYENAKDLELYVSPMMLEDQVINNRVFPFSIKGHISGPPSLNTSGAFNDFSKSIKSATKTFALQGWETGLLLKIIAEQCGDYIGDGEKIQQYLEQVFIDSPRGAVSFDSETNYFKGPSYLVTKKAGQKDYDCTMADYDDDEWKKFTSNPVQGVSSGWTNTYLCY